MQELKKSIAAILKYTTNLKSLVLIRDACVQYENSILNEACLNNAKLDNWSGVCEYLFKKQINLWSELVAPFYYSQSKVFYLCSLSYFDFKLYKYIITILMIQLIIETSFKAAHENIMKNLKECLLENSFDLSVEQK
jgi:hypothetical protein